MSRFLLALLVTLNAAGPASFAQQAEDPPVNILTEPGAVAKADQALLAQAGYVMDDGFVRREGEAPLTARQIKDVLAKLRQAESRAAENSVQRRRDRVDAARLTKATLALQKAWSRETGDDVQLSIKIADSGGAGLKASAVRLPAGVSGKTLSAAPAGSYRVPSGVIDHDAVGAERLAVAPATHGYSLIRLSSLEKADGSAKMAAAPTKLSAAKKAAAKPAPVEPPSPTGQTGNAGPKAPAGRLASIFLSDDLVNAMVKENLKAGALQDVSISFDPEKQEIIAQGALQIPDDIKAMARDEVKLRDLMFHVGFQLQATKEGYLILSFALDDVYVSEKGRENDPRSRLNVPSDYVAFALSLARGYIGMLAGDMSSFDAREAKLKAQAAALDRKIAAAGDGDEREGLKDQRSQLGLSLQGLAIERRQAARLAKKVTGVLAAVGEDEIHLKDDLQDDYNKIILKLDLKRLAPYLSGIQLGDVRIIKDAKDGEGENFLAIDLVSGGK